MKRAFYEQYREYDDLAVFKHGENDFPVHFHMNVEIFIMKKGSCNVIINGTEYHVSDDCVAFFSSYDLHGYKNSAANDERVVLIPPKYLVNFLPKIAKLQVKNPVVKNAKLCDALIEISGRILAAKDLSTDVKQAGVDLFLSLITQAFEFVPITSKNDTSLIREILNYILLHYRENVNVNSIAAALGYTREHLSRTFHEYFNESIPRYVNSLRLDYVKRTTANDLSARTSDVVFEAGFGSLQTFYRVKKQIEEEK